MIDPDDAPHQAAARARGTAHRLAGRERQCFSPEMERLNATQHLQAILAYGEGYSGEKAMRFVAIPA